MKRALSFLAAACLLAPSLAAQTSSIFEVRPFIGANVPTGTQRDFMKDAPMFGLQAGVEMRPSFHFVATGAWIAGKDKYAFTQDKVNVLQYTAGIELGRPMGMGETWEFRPFIGVGAGARTFLYQATELGDKTCAAAYGAIGGEFQVGRTALRAEARDYLYCYRDPMGVAESLTRNDLNFAIGLAYHFR